MNRKPIGPAAHGLIDYGFVALQTLTPTLFGFQNSARRLCYVFAATQGALNAVTDHSVGLKKLIPLRMHGQREIPFVPALLLLPWLCGALGERPARRCFVAFFVIALANLLLTDFNARKKADSS